MRQPSNACDAIIAVGINVLSFDQKPVALTYSFRLEL